MYEELAKALRNCVDGSCRTCPRFSICDEVDGSVLAWLFNDAADAIEELNRKVEDFEAMREISPEAEYAINKHVDNLISRLDELISGSEDKSRWIPVTEPPKYGDYYLVCDNCGRVYTTPFGNTGRWLESNITHWMPLPKPPKEET